jgi:hypothetical protein
MIYGTKMLESDTELFTAALTQTLVFVWSLDQYGIYYQVDTGLIEKYSQEHVMLRSSEDPTKAMLYPRETCEFSAR